MACENDKLSKLFREGEQKCPALGDVLCVPAGLSPLVTKLFALGVPPREAIWVILLYWAGYGGGLVGLFEP